MTAKKLKIGDHASMTKTISESDVYLFAGITGDLNPAHVNAVSSAQGAFSGRVAHGILVAGLISAVLGMQLPGPGTIYLGQELRFVSPVHLGDTITATATVTEIDEPKKLARLETICTNQNGTVVIKGSATVRPPQ